MIQYENNYRQQEMRYQKEIASQSQQNANAGQELKLLEMQKNKEIMMIKSSFD